MKGPDFQLAALWACLTLGSLTVTEEKKKEKDCYREPRSRILIITVTYMYDRFM